MTDAVRRARWAAWALLGALALAQAWIFRHEISPDGVAYLDLSDAIVAGRVGDLINGYWSPAYPFLIGVLRLVLEPTPLAAPQYEFAIVHVVNLLAFALALAAFEWLLGALDDAGARWGHQPFQSVVGRLAAYALFGVGALAMISVKGTVPDMLLAAATFGAFACLLRLQDDPGDRRSALRLGLLLAGGALTKSIVFPLGAVVMATMAWPLLRRGGGGGRASLAVAVAAFAIGTLPWVVALSLALGKPSTGETGALNYAWYVNGRQPANSGVIPALAAPSEPLPLDGLAVLRGARGTNPLWYDPARWHRDVRPSISLSQQWPKLWLSIQYYTYVLSPFLLALAAIAAASRWTDVKTAWERSYVILIPSLACVAAYSLVYTTSRYVAPVLVPAVLVLAAALPPDATLRWRRFVVVLLATLVVMDLVAPLRGRILLSWGLGLIVLTWVVARRARLEDPLEAARLRRAIALGVVVTAMLPGALMGFAAISARGTSAAHPEWATAQRLLANGLKPGSKIAVMGNPENSAWARLARYQIVAVIPSGRVEAFKALSPADRGRIIAAFQRAGAVDLIEIGVVDVP